MSQLLSMSRMLVLLSLFATLVVPVGAKETTSEYLTAFEYWRAADSSFSSWQLSGASLTADERLTLNPQTAQSEADPYAPGEYYGGNFYNGGSYLVGQAVSPKMAAPFAFKQAIASWNATTPAGTWVETQIRVSFGERWSKWYNLGIWAAGSSTIQRHSVRLQGDSDGYVAIDTLVVTNKDVNVDAYQLKARLFSEDGSAVPYVRNMSLTFSSTPDKVKELQPGDPASWNTLLDVPECSQMVYPDGGEIWCSPTSTSMVLGYWEKRLNGSTGPCEPRVRAAVDGVYDRVYDGHGNWPFNTAYASTHGLQGYVARFSSMAELEEWVAAGVPVVISYSWKKGDLTGAPIGSSGGHLSVVVGFDADGDPIVNDTAAASDEDVQRTYLREELESLWLEHSGGTAYLIYPQDWPVPSL